MIDGIIFLDDLSYVDKKPLFTCLSELQSLRSYTNFCLPPTLPEIVFNKDCLETITLILVLYLLLLQEKKKAKFTFQEFPS